jgi:hypothetical protein
MAIINFILWPIVVINAIIVAGIAIASIWAYGDVVIKPVCSIFLFKKHIK